LWVLRSSWHGYGSSPSPRTESWIQSLRQTRPGSHLDGVLQMASTFGVLEDEELRVWADRFARATEEPAPVVAPRTEAYLADLLAGLTVEKEESREAFDHTVWLLRSLRVLDQEEATAWLDRANAARG